MGKHTDQRDRTLLLARILYEETDETHPLPLTELAQRLAQRGVSAERKSLYRDMAALCRHGLSVSFRPGGAGGWYLTGRIFSVPELRTIIDAVTVYPWMTDTARAGIQRKLSLLAPRHRRESLRRPVTVCRPAAASPEAVREALDRIQSAEQKKKAVRFAPFVYDWRGKKRPDGPCRVVTPKGLLWTEEGYRLLGWDHKEKALGLFRPDRMDEVQVTGLPAQGPNVDPADWGAVPFGGDPTRREQLTLRCGPTMAGEILDRFGPDTVLTPEGNGFVFTADVTMSTAFWGWAAAHGDHLAVTAPTWAAKVWAERYARKPGRVRSQAV